MSRIARLPTLEDLRRASELRSIGHSWDAIAVCLGYSYEAIRGPLDAEYAQKRKVQKRRSDKNGARRSRYVRNFKGGMWEGMPRGRAEPPCPDALAERAYATSQTLTLDQHYFGDPLPGRSALDKRC